MNARITLQDGTVVCGTLLKNPECVCLRPAGHWGPHVVQNVSGAYVLMQTVCSPISFEIASAVAAIAMRDKNWTWAE